MFLSLFTLHFPPSSAQTALLSTIEQNNTTLAALRLSADADKLENRTDIYLSDPEIGFNYLWGNPSAIGSRKDYSITQSLDVATLTGSRSRLADIKDLSVEWQYLIDRQAILLEARQLLVDAVYYNAVLAEQQRRQQTADKLVTMTRKRLDAGDANILEYRNAKLSSDLLNADILVTIAQRDAVLADLSRLNGGKPLSITATTYDDTTTLPLSFDEWFAVAAEKNPVLQYVRNAVDISRQQLTISKQQGLPTLSVGYMGEKTMGELYHGISLGISVPLWSNKNRVRQARAAVTAAEQRAVDARQQFYGQLQTQYQRTIGLRQSADAMRRTLTDSDNTLLLQKALQSGELSVIDYLQQLSQYYDAIDKSLSADHEYQKALTDLMSVTE